MTSKVQERSRVRSIFRGLEEKGAISGGEILEITPMTHGASARRYYRLKTSSMSYIACLDKPFAIEGNPFLEVHHFLSGAKVRIPNLYGIDPAEGCLLLEDLGDCTLRNQSIGFDSKQELQVYKRCVDIVVQFQSISLGDKQYSFQKLKFDREKLDLEVDFTVTHFFQFAFKGNTRSWETVIGEVREAFYKINNEIVQKSVVFTHRDFHSQNIMVNEGDLVVIDFQDARMGPPQYDLVSLLDDCYYELEATAKEHLKKYYFGLLTRLVSDQKSYSDFSYYYDLVCMQRVFKAIGTFCFMFNDRKDESYLKYIAFAMEKLRRIMWKYQEFHSLRKNITALYYEY